MGTFPSGGGGGAAPMFYRLRRSSDNTLKRSNTYRLRKRSPSPSPSLSWMDMDIPVPHWLEYLAKVIATKGKKNVKVPSPDLGMGDADSLFRLKRTMSIPWLYWYFQRMRADSGEDRRGTGREDTEQAKRSFGSSQYRLKKDLWTPNMDKFRPRPRSPDPEPQPPQAVEDEILPDLFRLKKGAAYRLR